MEKPKINYYNKILKELTEFIKEKAGGRPVAIGLSGGIDSTLCAFLAYRALGKKNIHGILSPSRYTPEEDMEHVMKFAHKICGKIIKIKRGEIDKIREAYEHALPWKDENERIVLDAYIRNTLLRRYSRREGVRLLGTINGTEWKIGYYPKYSLIGDFLPIAGLFKTEVFELAEILNLPREIIEKKPTLGINRRSGYGCDPKDITQRKSKIDVELIKTGLNYKELDFILWGIEKNNPNEKIIREAHSINMNINSKQINAIQDLVKHYEHKTKLPPFPKIRRTKIGQ